MQGKILIDDKLEPPRLQISGDWTLAEYRALKPMVRATNSVDASVTLDWSGLGRLDTAGADLLVDLLGNQRIAKIGATETGLSAANNHLLQTIANAEIAYGTKPQHPPTRENSVVTRLAHIGRVTTEIGQQQLRLLDFIGLTLATFWRNLFHPHRWRVTALVAQMEATGLNAIPIVVLLNFMVGAVIAFLGSTVLSSLGASIYTVDLVGFAFLREVGVLLAAILAAGRTASAFTAQIGSMKVNEEIDAVRMLGLNPIELLVLPRVGALLITLPMLTFLAMLAGLAGGGLVCALSLDISPTLYLNILKTDISLRHFLLGLVKAPFFAFLIAVIGCLQGFEVAGSSASVGERTTSSVVQSIFIVIVVDAIAALFFMEMGW